MTKNVKLKVEEARRSDVGRQIARIPASVADELQIKTGDVIAIEGRRKTYAKAWRSSSPEVGPESIRIEPIVRKNAKIKLDDYVAISKADVTMADTVVLQPLQRTSVAGNLGPYLARAMTDRVLTTGDVVPVNTGFGGVLYLSVVKTEPSNKAVLFGKQTKLGLADEEQAQKMRRQQDQVSQAIEERDVPRVSYEDIGGLSSAIQKVREMIELPLRHPELFERLGITPPKGVLLYGPPGTGKTLLAKAIANETSSYFSNISGPEIMSKFYGESEERLREIFEEAKENAPAIVFIDELDAIAPKREDTTGEVERRIVAQLLSVMDGLEDRGNVVVIGATNRPDSIDPALRRGGRFDREIEIGIPDELARKEILQIHTRGMPLEEDVDMARLAGRTHGFVGADLEVLSKEAALASMRRFLPEIDLSEDSELDMEKLEKLNITSEDFEEALTQVSPSALREVYIERPKTTWKDIGGLDEVKDTLREAIEWPIKYREVFETMKAKPPTGILLYGPPGTGKTMLAKAVAREAEANFISIKGPELLSKWVGESEKGVREIFRKARSAAPTIIFFDEIDSITRTRSGGTTDSGVTERVVSQLLTEIDGLEEMRDVLILAASNRPDLIDPALMRKGRFDKVIPVGNPDIESRKEIFKVHMEGLKLSDKIDISQLAAQTEGLSGAEIASIVDNARSNAIREFIETSVDDKGDYEPEALKNLMLTKGHIDEAMVSLDHGEKEDYDYRPPGMSEVKDTTSFA